MSGHPRLTLGIGLGVGVISVAGLAVWWKFRAEKIPTRWRRAGELSDLMCFPIKSAGVVRSQELECTVLGVQNGRLRDRVFMVITLEGQFVTGRTHPKLVQVQPVVEGDNMKLSAPGMIDVDIDIERLHHIAPIKASVWGQTVDAVDCGEEAAKWFSRYLISEDVGLRLVYYPLEHSIREIREKNKDFDNLDAADSGALHDATSFNLLNESSVVELNNRLSREPVTPQQFRPNFVVKGPPAFEEDSWTYVKIGDTAVFRNVKPCTRCIFTNIDPETGLRDLQGEPLKTLKKYRLFPKLGPSPVLGIHLGIRTPGRVRVGDSVYVPV